MTLDVGSKTVIRAVLAVAAVWLLVQLWPIVLVVLVALMMAGALSPWVHALEQRGFARSTSIAIVFSAIFVAGASFAVLTLPHLVGQVVHLIERLPQTQAEIARQLDRNSATAPLARSVRGTRPTELVDAAAQAVLSYSGQIFEGIAYAATTFFLALYVIVDRDRTRGAAFALVPRHYHVRLSRILVNLETIVGGYVRGQVITSLLMAGFTFVVLAAVGVHDALTLAVVAAAADVLPYIGGVLICGPAAIATWPHGVGTTVGVVLALMAYQEFESRVIVPRVYGHALRLPSTVVLVSLLVGGRLLGIVGALLALPIAAAIRMIIEELRFELPGEEGARPSLAARDAVAEHAFEERAAGAPAERAAAIAVEIAEAQIRQETAAHDNH
jgi:predicted PurR-regulated permease PerM